jgi:hypothetical protein
MARRGSLFDAEGDAIAAKHHAMERQVKARFTVCERPGQRWLWVPDDASAFVPACVLEESKVRGRRRMRPAAVATARVV